MPNDDKFVLILAVVMIVAWIAFVFFRWVYRPRSGKLSFLATGAPLELSGLAVQLLQQHGYKVLHGKHKIPLKIIVNNDEEELLSSHIYIDYFAQKDDRTFAVRLAKSRLPIRWSGSEIRDHFLLYYLIYDDIDGVLYVDIDRSLVREISFVIDEDEIIKRGIR